MVFKMKREMSLFILLFVLIISGCNKSRIGSDIKDISNRTLVSLNTNYGEIILELYPDKAPVSVDNFLNYVESGFYNNTIFHRVIDGFMIQGGGFDTMLREKQTGNLPIPNEATNGLKNKRGTIAYARMSDPNSATSQFFINLVDNPHLDHKDNTPEGFGYAVFGRVIKGMNVVDHIGSVRTTTKNGMDDVPVENVVILTAKKIGDLK